jgi:hypothetical protein
VLITSSPGVRLGTGKHKQAIPKTNVIPAGIYRFATRVIYFLISGTIKLSVCFFYLRIFPSIRKPVLALIAFIVAATIAQEFATIFQCVPVAGVVSKFPEHFISLFAHFANFNTFGYLRTPETFRIGIGTCELAKYFLTKQY